jgi:hypothetical protein
MKKNLFLLLSITLLLVSCTSPRQKSQNPKVNQFYILDSDTIAELLHLDSSINSADILTKKKYNANDGFLVSAIARKLTPMMDDKLTYFLYSMEDRDQWYASYHNGILTIKEPSKLELGGINKKGLDFVNVFLAKIDMAKEKLSKEHDENLRKELISFQKKNFPKARKEYYTHAKDQLWKKDIKVVMEGKTIKFFGYMFIRNKVIEDTFNELHEELKKLRFVKVHFGADDGINEYSYTIKSKKDGEI